MKAKYKNNEILRKHAQKYTCGQTIAKLVSQHYYVRTDISIEDLANELNSSEDRDNSDIEVIGVVDDKNQVTGVIIRQELMDQLSRPYGRDVLKNYQVNEVARTIQFFHYSRNIFSVAEEINDMLSSRSVYYFTLIDEDNHFAGIFSTRDMLIYLSDNTKRDIAWARELQTSIIRECETICNDHFQAICIANMAKQVGGDFYYFKKYNQQHWLIALCDVSGKGIASSLVTAILGGMFSVYNFDFGIKKFIKILNGYLYQAFGQNRYLTGIFIDFSEETDEFIIFDLGHSHIFLYREKDLFRINTMTENLPLGVIPDLEPCMNKFKKAKDEILFLTTDGLLEQQNISGNTYSLKRVHTILKNNPDSELSDTVNILINDFHSFRGKQTQADDIAFIFVK
jgi:sigma-B regulation protein RsbU (phosphoserine phosphatase)